MPDGVRGRVQCGSAVLMALLAAGSMGLTQVAPPRRSVDATTAGKMREAIAAAERGDVQQALAISGELVKQHPAFAPALKMRGMIFEDMGQREAAAESYRAALKAAPNDAEMLVKVGAIELVQRNDGKALELLQRAAKLAPHDAEAKYYLSQAYHLHGDSDRALTAIAGAAKEAPRDAAILQKYGELLCSAGHGAEALAQLQRAQAIDPALKRIHFDFAVARLQAMDLSAAEEQAKREAELEPGDIENASLLASVQIRLGDWEGARGNLQRVLAVKGYNAAAMVSLGQCELELKDYPAAIDSLRQALELDPTLLLAHFYLSRAYRAIGDDAAAEHEAALHRQMLQYTYFEPSSADAKRSDTTEEQVQKAMVDGKEAEALTALGNDWVALGAAYLRADRTEDAERSFRHALEITETARDAHAYLGEIALQRGELSQAEAEFEGELRIDANQSFALGEIGEIRYRRGQWAQAAEMIVRSKSANPSLLYMLCDAYFRMGSVAKAELTAETVAAYSKGHPEIRQALGNLLKRNGKDAMAERLVPQPR